MTALSMYGNYHPDTPVIHVSIDKLVKIYKGKNVIPPKTKPRGVGVESEWDIKVLSSLAEIVLTQVDTACSIMTWHSVSHHCIFTGRAAQQVFVGDNIFLPWMKFKSIIKKL
jgi:hypothetical protein